jgi:hypothetical protein
MTAGMKILIMIFGSVPFNFLILLLADASDK